ncbi:acetone carboxylase subunit alpha [Sulfoacidibacillus thermotolerans]|uniref:Acetone carboxylase subunit alpha n=1 Tax=Sulfoacidibacillus thermotolerans TaxID=1765684 RepID=A0A2U3D9D9_SULT2|nr:acetone carboxylase subunit alpha [Sulfoacidibacillus thermotolerans]
MGWNGKTLKAMREEVDRLTEESGYYAGLKELPFKQSDPIRFEKIFSKLRGGLVHARETAKRVAASPIVEQEGELCFTLYTPEGDSIVTSTGIIIHVGTMGAAIKYMVNHNYEENPGIEPGDIFCNNDCQIGNVHPCDVHTIVPIFWAGEVVGWVGGVTHVIDTGATGPGSMTVGPVTRYDDGYQIACRKIGKNDILSQDWVIESQRSVRTTKYWLLDERTRIAGCHMIRDLVLGIISEEGVDSYRQFTREVIEEGRRGLINRVKAMTIPGKYRQVSFVDIPYRHEDVEVPPYAKVDTIMHAPSEITIHPSGQMELDFSGSSRWGWHSYNATTVSFTSGIWVMLTQTLIPNDRINDGAYFATKFDLPYGAWMNPDDIRTAHSYAWHFLVSAWSPLWRGLSRAYFARGYIEEVNAGNANTSNWLQGGGYNQYGDIHAVNSFEAAAEGMGACAVKDGLDHACAIWNPEGDMGDMEIWELAEPLVYLGRSIKPNTGGYGKYRGGCGYESLRMVWGAEDWTMFFMGNGYISSDCGLMGGYPAASGYRFEAHGTDLKERFANRLPFPQGGDARPADAGYEQVLQADVVKRDKQAITTEQIFENHDLYLNYLRGGPGFGDPLERNPKDVEKDLNGGYLLPEYAQKVYGAVFTKDERGHYQVDEVATQKRQQEIRKERLARGVPTREWMKTERERIVAKDAAVQVRHMYATSFEITPKFLEEFKEFWDLPVDWNLLEQELEMPTFGSSHRMVNKQK